MKPPDNRYLRRSSVSVPREQRTAWQVFRLVLECVFVVVLLMGIAASIYAIYQRLSQQNFFPLKRVIIQEPLRYGDMREVSEIIRNHHQRDLLHMDVTLLADEMQRLDWIAKASVYKRWPDAVEVKLEERVPVVRWGGRAFLDASGEPFSIPDNDKLRELATIHGPDGYEKQVLQYWHDIAPWLGARQLQLQQLSLDQRLVWHAELENGLDVILGRDQLNDRLKKLAVVNDKVIKPYHRYIEAIDLRYHDGFSVRWKAGVKPVTAEKNPARDSDGIVKTVTVVKETPAVKEAAKPAAKETAKPAAKPAAVAKEKTAAKPAPKEPSKENKEKAPAKPASAAKETIKEAAKEKPAAKPAPVAKETTKENKEKTVAKPAASEKVAAKESAKPAKEKTAAKPAAAEKAVEKTPPKENKEKPAAKPAATEKAPVKEAKEKPAAKAASAEKTPPKENKEKTANKAAPAAKPVAPKEKDSAKGKK